MFGFGGRIAILLMASGAEVFRGSSSFAEKKKAARLVLLNFGKATPAPTDGQKVDYEVPNERTIKLWFSSERSKSPHGKKLSFVSMCMKGQYLSSGRVFDDKWLSVDVFIVMKDLIRNGYIAPSVIASLINEALETSCEDSRASGFGFLFEPFIEKMEPSVVQDFISQYEGKYLAYRIHSLGQLVQEPITIERGGDNMPKCTAITIAKNRYEGKVLFDEKSIYIIVSQAANKEPKKTNMEMVILNLRSDAYNFKQDGYLFGILLGRTDAGGIAASSRIILKRYNDDGDDDKFVANCVDQGQGSVYKQLLSIDNRHHADEKILLINNEHCLTRLLNPSR